MQSYNYFTRGEPRFCKNWPWTSFSPKHFTCHRQSVANPRVHRVVAQYVIISKSKCGYLKNQLRELASKRSWRPGHAFCFDGNPVETFWGLELQLRAVDGCLGPKVGLGLGYLWGTYGVPSVVTHSHHSHIPHYPTMSHSTCFSWKKHMEQKPSESQMKLAVVLLLFWAMSRAQAWKWYTLIFKNNYGKYPT